MFEERLSESFEGLQGHGPRCEGYCEMMHTEDQVVDLKSSKFVETQEKFSEVNERQRKEPVVREPDSPSAFLYPESESEDEPNLGDRQIRFSKTIVTLPGQSQRIACWSSKNALFVASNRKVYVFPRDKPHYKDAVCAKGSLFFEINRVIVRKTEDRRYSLCDFSSKEFVDYPKPPVASYNGLIWTCETKGSLVCSFLDLETGKQYFSLKKSIQFSPNFYGDSMGSFKQCSKYPQFCVAKFNRGLILLDLKQTTVTQLINPLNFAYEEDDDGDELHVFPGYPNGKFDTRYTDPEDDGLEEMMATTVKRREVVGRMIVGRMIVGRIMIINDYYE